MPSANRAVVTVAKGQAEVVDVTIPQLRDDHIIVKVKAVALNPTDWKHIDFHPTIGARVGCDYAGIVEQVGSKVSKDFKKGDRVAGFTHGSNALDPETGAFAEYITAKGDLQIKIPDTLSFEEASTLGVGVSTVGQTLYQTLKLPLPGQQPKTDTPILIYGGSTATGTLAIQYAKLSGATVITTCSPRNFELVKSLGADAVFDYSSPDCSASIRNYTSSSLSQALDCIASDSSSVICAESMSPTSGGTYVNLLSRDPSSVTDVNPKIAVVATLAYTMLGEDAQLFGHAIPANRENWEFGKMFWELSRGLLESGQIKVHPPSANKYGEGLEGVLKGLDAMRKGEVSGEKLVFTL